MLEAANANDANDKLALNAAASQPESAGGGDVELAAINEIVKALSPLNLEQRIRALEYVNQRFDIATKSRSVGVTPSETKRAEASISDGPTAAAPARAPGIIQDIRTLKETKKPKSAIEMATLVGYYVSEIAPEADRKKDIGKPDIEKYFKAAGFTLPSDAGFTLVNAKNAGYLDSAGGGQYRLNPVGYNLVVHRMESRGEKPKRSERVKKTRPKVRTKAVKKAPRVKK